MVELLRVMFVNGLFASEMEMLIRKTENFPACFRKLLIKNLKWWLRDITDLIHSSLRAVASHLQTLEYSNRDNVCVPLKKCSTFPSMIFSSNGGKTGHFFLKDGQGRCTMDNLKKNYSEQISGLKRRDFLQKKKCFPSKMNPEKLALDPRLKNLFSTRRSCIYIEALEYHCPLRNLFQRSIIEFW